MLDIVVTTHFPRDKDKAFKRLEVTTQSFTSLFNSIGEFKNEIRTTLVVDGPISSISAVHLFPWDYVILNKGNLGVSVSINSALELISMRSKYYKHPSKNGVRYSDSPDYVSLNNDDVEYVDGWHKVCIDTLNTEFGSKYPKYVSAYRPPENGNPTMFKATGKGRTYEGRRYLSGVQWMGRAPDIVYTSRIPQDFNDGKERGNPDNGRGSRSDWWFMKDAPNSVENEKAFCVCFDMLKHIGGETSTWH